MELGQRLITKVKINAMKLLFELGATILVAIRHKLELVLLKSLRK